MSGLTRFVLARGEETGVLYLYHREVWDNLRGKTLFAVVAESDDAEELKNMQKLVNKDFLKEMQP